MVSGNGFWKGFITAGSIIGGAWLLSELIKGASQKVYRCPKCSCLINEGSSSCANCNVQLRW